MKKIIVSNNFSLWKYLFADIEMHNGTIHSFPFNGIQNHRFKSLLHRLCSSKKYKLPFLKKLWYRHILKAWGVLKGNAATVLFLNPALPMATIDFLRYLSNQKHITLKLLFIDELQYLPNNILSLNQPLLSFFDTIYTFSPKDAANNDWVLTYNYYSKIQAHPSQVIYDVFLVMHNKGRLEKALTLYDYFESRGIKCLFVITGVPEEIATKASRCGIIYNTVLSYNQIVEYILKSNVILEICQINQHSPTLRTLESIVYQKKLITNNLNISNFDYYYSLHHKTFSVPEDLNELSKTFFTTPIEAPCEKNPFSPLQLF